MLILTIKTDQPLAQLALFDDQRELAKENWQAHRQLAETIHTKLRELLKSQGKDIHDLNGIVCYQGPGSFTGLRIGLSVGNALAYGLEIPVIGAQDKTWQADGIAELQAGKNNITALPEYGAAPHITQPRK